jgi:hypothetical protein
LQKLSIHPFMLSKKQGKIQIALLSFFDKRLITQGPPVSGLGFFSGCRRILLQTVCWQHAIDNEGRHRIIEVNDTVSAVAASAGGTMEQGRDWQAETPPGQQ